MTKIRSCQTYMQHTIIFEESNNETERIVITLTLNWIRYLLMAYSDRTVGLGLGPGLIQRQSIGPA